MVLRPLTPVAEHERSGAPVLLLDESVADDFESQDDSRIPGSMILDGFIAQRYGLMCAFGDFRVMPRIDAGAAVPPCPDLVGQP